MCSIFSLPRLPDPAQTSITESLKYWVKTGYIQGVKRNERTMIPLSEIERITGDDRVRRIRVAGELDDATRELGRPMTDDEMQDLEAARPGKVPWAR